MMIVDRFIKDITDEIDGACRHAENYIFYKKSNPTWAKYYHEMAAEELKHAQYMYDISEAKIKQLQDTYSTSDDSKAWENLMKEYIEKNAMIKNILAM